MPATASVYEDNSLVHSFNLGTHFIVFVIVDIHKPKVSPTPVATYSKFQGQLVANFKLSPVFADCQMFVITSVNALSSREQEFK